MERVRTWWNLISREPYSRKEQRSARAIHEVNGWLRSTFVDAFWIHFALAFVRATFYSLFTFLSLSILTGVLETILATSLARAAFVTALASGGTVGALAPTSESLTPIIPYALTAILTCLRLGRTRAAGMGIPGGKGIPGYPDSGFPQICPQCILRSFTHLQQLGRHRSYLAVVAGTPSCRHWEQRWGPAGRWRLLAVVDKGSTEGMPPHKVLLAARHTYVVLEYEVVAAPLSPRWRAHSYLPGYLTFP